MLSSQLNKIITIERSTPDVNSVGSPILTWAEYRTTYSKVSVPSGDTRFTQNGELFEYRTEFLVRYNEFTKIVNNNFRIKYNGVYYKILQCIEIGIKEGMKFVTVAFDNNGYPAI